MSLCFVVSYLLRVYVHAHQLGHAADPHRINAGDVYQFGCVGYRGSSRSLITPALLSEAPTSAEQVRHEPCNPVAGA
jgi:hypothetical protein